MFAWESVEKILFINVVSEVGAGSVSWYRPMVREERESWFRWVVIRQIMGSRKHKKRKEGCSSCLLHNRKNRVIIRLLFCFYIEVWIGVGKVSRLIFLVMQKEGKRCWLVVLGISG